MSTLLTSRFKRFVPFGLIALAAALLWAPAPASATPFVVRVMQQGSNVVAVGRSSMNLDSLTCQGGWVQDSVIIPSEGLLQIGPLVSAAEQCYGANSFSGPNAFGTGAMSGPWNGTGDFVGVYMLGGFGHVFVPANYTSDTSLSSSSTWDGASFASLGVTPGTYVWTWGTGPDQNFKLIIGGTVAVSEPPALTMFGMGLLLLGGFVGLRRRVA